MAAGDVVDYQISLCPPWLLAEYGEAFELFMGLIKDAVAEGAREVVVQRFVQLCALDALAKHGAMREILRAPGEPLDAFRARLDGAWAAWQQAGTPGGILAQLVPAGITSATVVEGVSIDPVIPSGWATWYLRVHEPHPFSPPIVYGGGRTYGDGALYGFATDFALAYARAIVRKWNPAHARCTGILVEFSTPSTEVRLPV